MPRQGFSLVISFLLLAALSCERSKSPAPVVVHVLRDSSAAFAKDLRLADYQFGLTNPHLNNGRVVMIATNEGDSYAMLLRQFAGSTPDLLILDSQSDLPIDLAIRKQLGTAVLVCGQHPAFIAASVSGEQREGAQEYLQFLVSHCGSTNAVNRQDSPSASSENLIEEMFPHAKKKAENVRCFRSLTPAMSIQDVVQRCGRPDQEAGSGIYIFLYYLRNGSTVAIGTADLNRTDHVTYTDPTGKSESLLHPER